jgi:hypothetical protein
VERLLRDVHPAEVVLSDGRMFIGVRVFLTDQRVIVWKEERDRQVSKALDLPITFTPADRSRNTLGANERLEFFSDEVNGVINKRKGCACSSQLKALGLPHRLDGTKLSWSGK